jgi:hypothetical protein
MTLEQFKTIIDSLNNSHEKLAELYKIGIDITTLISVPINSIFILLESYFGIDGKETIEWWLYDPSDKVIMYKNEHDIDIVLYDLTNIEDLYAYLMYERKKAI